MAPPVLWARHSAASNSSASVTTKVHMAAWITPEPEPAAVVAPVRLYSPCQTATARMLPPVWLYKPGQHDGSAGESEDEDREHGGREVLIGVQQEELRDVPACPGSGDDQAAGEWTEAALQLGECVTAPAGFLSEPVHQQDEGPHPQQPEAGRQAAEAGEVIAWGAG